ncbi:DUF1569 domain-containing protein [Flavobacterium sp. ZB4P13]|uniref:DUF1569 domain-containing protein n=1 Tax=Flavobacterium sp. ZB4P13 TaxID=3401728 RepID=UPI003AB09BBE
MKNIFDKKDNQELIERVQKLTSASKSTWGEMSVSQMVLHCQKPLDVAEGKLELKRNIIGFLFGKMAKRSFLQNEYFKKNLPTDKGFIIKSSPDFEKEKEVLCSQIARFGAMGPTIIANSRHPFFGEMTEEEWGILQYKHLDHHLKQFGC